MDEIKISTDDNYKLKTKYIKQLSEELESKQNQAETEGESQERRRSLLY